MSLKDSSTKSEVKDKLIEVFTQTIRVRNLNQKASLSLTLDVSIMVYYLSRIQMGRQDSPLIWASQRSFSTLDRIAFPLTPRCSLSSGKSVLTASLKRGKETVLLNLRALSSLSSTTRRITRMSNSTLTSSASMENLALTHKSKVFMK